MTLDATLSEAGMAVAELVKREAEQRRGYAKVNVEGIEEMVADRGYTAAGFGAGEELRSADLHSEKKQAGQRHWEGKRGATGGVPESTAGARRLRQSLLRRRGDWWNAALRLLRDGRHEAHTSTRTREYSEAATGPCGGLQLEPDLAQVLGAGTPRQWKDLEGTRFLLFIYYLVVGKIVIGSPEAESQYLVRNRSSNHEARLAARRGWSCRKLLTSTGLLAARGVSPDA